MKARMKARSSHPSPLFVVDVIQTDGVWTAVCDELGLVTEADDLETLEERVWELAPELAELNGLDIDAGDLRIHFQGGGDDLRHAL
jgi:hypothetical protein